jgi:ankyrin repeat protein
MRGTTEPVLHPSEITGTENGSPTSTSPIAARAAASAVPEATTAQQMMDEFQSTKSCKIKFDGLDPITATLVGTNAVHFSLGEERSGRFDKSGKLKHTTINNLWNLFLLRAKEIEIKQPIASVIAHSSTKKNNTQRLLYQMFVQKKTILHWLVNAGGLIINHTKWLEELFTGPPEIFNKIFVCDNTNSSFLHEAVYRGNIELLKALLPKVYKASGACPNWRDKVLSSRNHKGELFINWRNENAETALMVACWRGKINIAHLLINAGADLNLQNEWGRTALILAVKMKNFKIAQRLINAGAYLNLRDGWRRTALMHACINEDCETVQQLIADKADPNLRDKYKADPNLRDKWGNTALTYACIRENCAIVQQLIAAKADLNVQNKWGRTALILAVINSNCEIVQQLIAAKADLNLRDKWGYTALMYARIQGNHALADQLIKAGADFNIQNMGTCYYVNQHWPVPIDSTTHQVAYPPIAQGSYNHIPQESPPVAHGSYNHTPQGSPPVAHGTHTTIHVVPIGSTIHIVPINSIHHVAYPPIAYGGYHPTPQDCPHQWSMTSPHACAPHGISSMKTGVATAANVQANASQFTGGASVAQ